MRRIYRRLFMVVLSLALATTTTVATIATPAQATTIANQTGQQKALYQSELEQNLLLRTQLGYGFIAEYGPLRMPPARPYADQTDLSCRPAGHCSTYGAGDLRECGDSTALSLRSRMGSALGAAEDPRGKFAFVTPPNFAPDGPA